MTALRVAFAPLFFKVSLHFLKCISNIDSPAFLPNKDALKGLLAFSPLSLRAKYKSPCWGFPCNLASTFSAVILKRESKALYCPKVWN